MFKEKKITAVIIEDDEEALSLLEAYLKAFDKIEIIDKTTNPVTGVGLLKKVVPDIVFLDIDMPGLSGLKIAETIKARRLKTEVIFTTAHSSFAYEALQTEPFDYLIKPFGPDDLSTVIERYTNRVQARELERRVNIFMRTSKAIPKVKLPTHEGAIFITPDDIMMLKAELNYCRVYTTNKKDELILLSMSKVISLIDSQHIFRANRSSCINLRYLKTIEKKTSACTIEYDDFNLEARISRMSFKILVKICCLTY